MFLCFWNFDIMLTQYWLKIANFWNDGGTINRFNDIVFVLSIFLIIPFWLYVLIKLINFKLLNLLLYPVNRYNNYIAKKYGPDSSKIRFKNLGSVSKDISIEEMVNMRMKESEKKGEKELEATRIRNIIREKIKNKK